MDNFDFDEYDDMRVEPDHEILDFDEYDYTPRGFSFPGSDVY